MPLKVEIPETQESNLRKLEKMLQLPASETAGTILENALNNAIQAGQVDGLEWMLLNRVFDTRRAADQALEADGQLLAEAYRPRAVKFTLGQLSVERDEDGQGWLIVRDDASGAPG